MLLNIKKDCKILSQDFESFNIDALADKTF